MHRRLHLAYVASLLVALAVALLSSDLVAAQGNEAQGPNGAQLFAATCSGCHQAEGQGVPGAFPPLAGHAQELYEAAEGPRYLASVVLFGLQGPIVVQGQTYDGQMPSFFNLPDEQLAAILDHVLTALGDAEPPEGYVPVTAEDVRSARRAALSPALVYQRRPQLADVEGEASTAELTDATFAAEQVDRALPVYRRLCVECHGEDLTGGLIGGPPLTGTMYRQKWGGKPLSGLYSFM